MSAQAKGADICGLPYSLRRRCSVTAWKEAGSIDLPANSGGTTVTDRPVRGGLFIFQYSICNIPLAGRVYSFGNDSGQ